MTNTVHTRSYLFSQTAFDQMYPEVVATLENQARADIRAAIPGPVDEESITLGWLHEEEREMTDENGNTWVMPAQVMLWVEAREI